jgi:hypothetical protein
LKEDELKIINNLVSGYFDLAEINATILTSGSRKILTGSGSISHDSATKILLKENNLTNQVY